MLHVVPDACQFATDMSSGTITIESDETKHFPTAIEDLTSTNAKNLSLQYAAQSGVPDPRINGHAAGAYPINSEGYPLDLVKDESGNSLPPAHPRMQPARYRIEIPITRKLI